MCDFSFKKYAKSFCFWQKHPVFLTMMVPRVDGATTAQQSTLGPIYCWHEIVQVITGKNYGDHNVSNSFLFDHWLGGDYCHLVVSSSYNI